ncbi:MAG: PQQ-dependent sugar dehydrogenase [Balneolales bacterium]
MRFLLYFLLCPLLTGCDQKLSDPPRSNTNQYQVTEAFPELTFTRPVDFQQPGASDLLFVVEQRGVISVFQNDEAASDSQVFLDISDQVDDSGNEEGLLGLAFHPDYQSNGYFYVNYTATNPDRTVISRFQVSPDNPEQADQTSEQEVLSFAQPYSNHNGGQVSFGPDSYLYIAVGDGGSGGDPEENGQDRTTLLGTILRIDVDNQQSGQNYAIPSDNPFVGNDEGYREEIYAWGLRNPWRFSFDVANDRLWTGDVGQNQYEEIDIIEKGRNYGWNIMEGFHCFEPSEGCDQSGLEMPIWEYDRSEGDISVTGGFVYRGLTLTDLTGQYIFADYASGRIWALDYSDMDNPVNTEILQADFAIPSFGVDQDNELYICGFDGKIYKLEVTD